MRSSDIRRQNARNLAEDIGGSAELARRISMSDSQVSQLIGENPVKNIGQIIARRIEEAFNKPEGWLDIPHDYVAPASDAHAVREKSVDYGAEDSSLVSSQDILTLIEAFSKASIKDRTMILNSAKVAADRSARKAKTGTGNN